MLESRSSIGTLCESDICRTQFPWKSTEYVTFEQNWNWECFPTLPSHLGNYMHHIKLQRLTEKYFPSWVCGSEVILCWDDGFVSPVVHKTRPTGSFIPMNEHHHIGVQCEWNSDRAVSIVMFIINCKCMYFQLIWHFTRRNTSHLCMSMKKREFLNISQKE